MSKPEIVLQLDGLRGKERLEQKNAYCAWEEVPTMEELHRLSDRKQ